jgi:hypothetical protein
MAWRFRRSLKLGPLKLNFSRSGIGYSAGVRGFRVDTDAKGSTYTAASIPGTVSTIAHITVRASRLPRIRFRFLAYLDSQRREAALNCSSRS